MRKYEKRHIQVQETGMSNDILFKDGTGPGVDSASNRNEYQESLKIKKPGGKMLPARRADNLAAIY
jgi:hypothetical protein